MTPFPESAPAPPPSTRRGIRARWLLGLLLVGAAVALRSEDLTLPFTGRNDSEGTFNSNAARNLLRYGYLDCRIAILTKSGPWEPGVSPLYLHHPMLYTVILTEVFRWTGVHEWAARATWIVLSVLTLLLTWRLMSLIGGERCGWVAACLLAFLPIDVHFGKLVSWRLLVITFAQALLISYTLWIRTGKPRHYWTAVLFQALLCQSAWPGYFMGLFLPVTHWMWRRSEGRRMWLFPVVCVLSFGLHLAHNAWAGGLDSLFEALRGRIAGGERPASSGFSLVGYVGVQGWRLATRFGPPVLALALLGLVRRKAIPGGDLWPQYLAIWGMIAVPQYVLFAPFSYIHEDDIGYLIPFIVGAAAPVASSLLDPGAAATRLRRGGACLILGLHIALGAYLSHRSTSQRMGYHLETYWSQAARAATPFEAALATNLKLCEAHYNFYVDRRVHADVTSEPSLRRCMDEDPALQYFVTTTADHLKARYPYYRGVPADYFASVGVLSPGDPFLMRMTELFPVEERDGFLFFKLRIP